MPAGLWAWEPAASLRSAVSIFEGQLATWDTIEKYKIKELIIWKDEKSGKGGKKGKTSWENKVQQLPLALLTARTGNSLENKNWSEIGEIIIVYWFSQLKNRNYNTSWLLEECVVHPLMSLCHRKDLLFIQTGALSSGHFLHCLWFSYTGWAPCTNFPQNLLDKLLDSH